MPPLTLPQKLAATALGCLLFIVVLRLVRKRQLDTALSFWWIMASVAIVALAWCDELLRSLAIRMQLEIRSFVLVCGILFLLFTCLHISTNITRLSHQSRQLSQALTLHCADESRDDARITGPELNGDSVAEKDSYSKNTPDEE